jgi:hypothetical protein
MKNVGSFYVHLEYLTAIRKILCHLVGFVVIWNLFPFWYVVPKKNLATLL